MCPPLVPLAGDANGREPRPPRPAYIEARPFARACRSNLREPVRRTSRPCSASNAVRSQALHKAAGLDGFGPPVLSGSITLVGTALRPGWLLLKSLRFGVSRTGTCDEQCRTCEKNFSEMSKRRRLKVHSPLSMSQRASGSGCQVLAQGGADDLAVGGVVAGGSAPKGVQEFGVDPDRNELRGPGADGRSTPATDLPPR